MLSFGGPGRILLFQEPADMRKGFDGLSGLVRAAGHEPLDGSLFVFISRRKDRAKVVTFQQGGSVVVYKRLERGRFRVRAGSQKDVALIDATALAMLLDGIDFSRVRRANHWRPKNS